MLTLKPQIKKLLFTVCVLVSFTSLSQKSDFKLIVIENISPEKLGIIGNCGIDLTCGADLKNNSLQLEVSEFELGKLKSNGIQFKVLIEDLVAFYSERSVEDLPKAKKELDLLKEKSIKNKVKGVANKSISEVLNNIGQYTGQYEIDWSTPLNFNLNPNTVSNTFGGCLTYDMVLQELDDMRSLYPNLISVKANASPTNQKTLENRIVYYVRISDNPDVDEANEPETLYQSLIHSREAASLMNQLYFMWYILENYATDISIKNLVNNHELYFVPVFNPDGFVYNQTVAPNGGGGQRKNRNTSAPGSCSTFLEGIDLNRNSAYYWGNGGSSTDPCNDTYMGVGPFSENETQIMREFVLQHNFKIALNHHSYKNAMLHGYAGTTITNPRPDEYSKYSHDMSFYNRFAYGPSTSISYLNSGNMNDWMLGGPEDTNARGATTDSSYPFPANNVGSGMNILSWTPENGLSSQGTGGTYGGFWPSPSNFVPIAKNAMRMNFLAAYYSGKYAKLHDFNQSNITATSGNLKFAIENLGQNGSDSTPLTNAFTITVTPVSSNITITGGGTVTENFTSAQILEQRNVAIGYTLSSGIQPNDKIEYKVTLRNDYASDNILYEATIVKYYNPTVLFNDNPDINNLTNWTQTGSWYTTATDGYLGTKGITASNTIPYANNVSKKLQMNGLVNLTGVSEALVQFYAKWDLERSFDYVQIEGSSNGTTWVPLVGKYTKPGATNASNPYDNKTSTDEYFQPDNEMLYDGDTQGKWVMEEIVINSSTNSSLYNKGTVYLRFDFNSNASNTEDSYYNMDFEGFTFDDFKVIKIQEPCTVTVPTGLTTSSITSSGATLNWTVIPSATYDLRYKKVSNSTWTNVVDLTTSSSLVSGLEPSTNYEFQVRSKCSPTNSSAYSASSNFTTLNISYCTSNGDTNDRGISKVVFNTISNSSNTATGYSNFTNLSTDVNTGTSYNLAVNLTTGNGNNTLYAYAFIDFNKDGVFSTSERFDLGNVIKNNTNATSSLTPNIAIPINANIGTTRMRISAKNGSYPTSCETSFDGEVEDYTINIISSTLSIEDSILNKFLVYPNPSNGKDVTIKMPNEIKEFNISVTNSLGIKLYTENVQQLKNSTHVLPTTNLTTGIYFITVSTNLGSATKKMIIK